MSNPAEFAVDHPQRQRALDVTGSFIVQAPAGSGKTELLIQRILALLAIADTPEEILAITFTRKAAAEMRNRLLEALDKAQNASAPDQAHAAQTWALARAALTRDQLCGWNLLDNPVRLQVTTIDSFCAALIRRMPWLARFGEAPAIADDPATLYALAAEHLLARLERGGEGQAAIERLLAHLDNQMPLLRDLLVAMLARRDQWLRHLDPVNLATARPELEKALRLEILAALQALHGEFDSGLLGEFCALGAWAADNLSSAGEDNPLAVLAGRSAPPVAAIEDLPVWSALVYLVLTGAGDVRKTVNKTLGFPSGSEHLGKEMKMRLVEALEQLRERPETVRLMQELRHLPAIAFNDEQWQTLAALIELLPLADRDLRETFRAHGQVDFVEVARGALVALGDELAPADLLLHLDSRLRHLLVDEFQDTARGQYELLSRLTAGWEPGDGRTLFLVGDPMQSIYRFREAEVGLYLRVRRQGLDNVCLAPLTLQANFRSQADLVAWFNITFAQLFPATEDETRGAVPYAAATMARKAIPGPAITMTCFAGRDDAAEALHIIALIDQARVENPHGQVAVLVRSRSHLTALIPALKAAGLAWQAQEIDPLSSRPVICDLLALTRALLHPADRVAWLSVLRAPWSGLTLDDLLQLCGDSPAATIWECMTGHAGQAQLFPALSVDGQTRLTTITAILEKALAGKGRVTLRRMVEATWLALNGPAGLAGGDLDDAERFFTLLEELDEGGDLVSLEVLSERLDGLFAAPDPTAGPGLQLMTIHKAKGLEFDTVIVPGLGRSVRTSERSLLLWQEQIDPRRVREGLLLAPIPASIADDQDPTYRAIASIHAEKDRQETLRLFYVAATRARQRLHLLGHAARNANGTLSPATGSLLKAAWSALGPLAETCTIETLPVNPSPKAPDRMLRRLPLGWSAPQLASAVAIALPARRRASDIGHQEGLSRSFSLRTDEGRIIGTVVHAWLEVIASEGVENWSPARLQTGRAGLCTTLMSSGVPRMRAGTCADRALKALGNTLLSPRGRWILARHRDAACEVALSGVVDGVAVHAVIDRTFVDEDGVLWIVDYKTSAPDEGVNLETFLVKESERYRGQLDDYRRLMSMRTPACDVRTALYFPLVDAWREVT